MRMFFIVLGVILAMPIWAEVQFVKVSSQFASPHDSSIIILKLENGQTAFWNPKTIDSVSPEELEKHEGLVQLDLDESQNVLTLNLVQGFVPVRPTVSAMNTFNNAPYSPSILASYTVTQDILRSFNTQTAEDAQCYDKAHRWVYDEYVSYGTKLMKIFLFFSDDYIARYKFKWWFHAAPFAYLRMQNQTTERVLDPTFFSEPLKFKLWTDIFMKNKVECKVISKYSQYTSDTTKSDCFLHKATMYFWQPKDLQAYETAGTDRTAFIPWEIDWAYEHGFGVPRAH